MISDHEVLSEEPAALASIETVEAFPDDRVTDASPA